MAYNYAAGGGGAASGALAGAAAGSVVPGLGTAAGAVIGGLAGAAGGFLGGSGNGGGGQFILSDEEKVLLQERARNQALLRKFAEGGNTYDPYAALNVRDALEARLGRGQAAAFTRGQSALNAAGGATTGQLMDLQKGLNEDYLNRLGEQEEKVQFLRAGHQANTQLSGLGQLGGGPAPTPTYIADQPKEDSLGKALGGLGAAGLDYFSQQRQQKAEDARFNKYLQAFGNKSQLGGNQYSVNTGVPGYGSYGTFK